MTSMSKADIVKERDAYRARSIERCMEIQSLHSENDDLKRQIRILENEKKHGQWPELTAGHNLVLRQNRDLIETNRTLTARIDELETKLESALTSNVAMLERLEDLKTQNERLSTDLKHHVKLVADLRNKENQS